jgi:hypothetical protein
MIGYLIPLWTPAAPARLVYAPDLGYAYFIWGIVGNTFFFYSSFTGT